MAVRITHTNNSDGHDGTFVYRSTSTMDPQALPAPIADEPPVALGAVFEYIDSDLLADNIYHYRTQDHEGGQVSAVSDEISIQVGINPPDRDTVTIALVVADSGHAATTNTKQALLDAGFLDGNITVHTDTTSPPASDIIVVSRGVDTQADWDLISPEWDSGTPVILGSANGLPAGIGHSMAATFANLTGTFAVDDSSPGTNENDIVDNFNYITQTFPLGKIEIYSAQNFGFSVEEGQVFAGTHLADADPEGGGNVSGNPTLIAMNAGAPDLQGNATPAKSVVWGDLYGGQSTYTADGAELLARCIDWCLG